MSLNGAIVKTGATAIAPTGGTDLTMVTSRVDAQKVIAQVAADTDFRTKRSFEFTAKGPTAQASAPNGYTQVRNIAKIKVPRVLANGKITVDTLDIALSTDVETSSANRKDLRYIGAQLLGDTDFDGFWDNQSLT